MPGGKEDRGEPLGLPVVWEMAMVAHLLCSHFSNLAYPAYFRDEEVKAKWSGNVLTQLLKETPCQNLREEDKEEISKMILW